MQRDHFEAPHLLITPSDDEKSLVGARRGRARGVGRITGDRRGWARADRARGLRWLRGRRVDVRPDGVCLGALAFQRWEDNRDRNPTATVLPDVDFRFGRRAGFHGGLGFGAYNVTTTFRPGAFIGLGYASGPWAADLRGGVHLVFDDQAGGRVDASFRYGISRAVAPGLGLAVTSADQLTPEGRLFVVFTP